MAACWQLTWGPWGEHTPEAQSLTRTSVIKNKFISKI